MRYKAKCEKKHERECMLIEIEVEEGEGEMRELKRYLFCICTWTVPFVSFIFPEVPCVYGKTTTMKSIRKKNPRLKRLGNVFFYVRPLNVLCLFLRLILHLHWQEEGMKKLRLKIYDLAENKRKRFSSFLKPNVPVKIYLNRT